ncbi:MAG TPA: HAD family phosphatase [Candidatus Acidoferrales bacterium]|nr:HAD family phosphatase [Candidatus Acidoferrales bacterium]
MIPASRIGAFFDIDGTLLPPPPIEWRFAMWLVRRRLLSRRRIAKWAMAAVCPLSNGNAMAIRTNKAYLAGLRASIFEDWEASLAPNALALFPEGVDRLAYHFEQGHRIFLISGTLVPLAQTMGRRIGGAVEVCATELSSIDGAYSGRIEGKHLSGSAKADVAVQIARDSGVSLADSHAYGNHMDDLAMLSSVGCPVAVNPTRQLKRIARHRHWCTLRWVAAESAATFPPRRQFVSPKETH